MKIAKIFTLKIAIIAGIAALSIISIWLFVAVISPEAPGKHKFNDLEGLDLTPREIPLFDKPANNKKKEVEKNNTEKSNE